MSRDLSRRNTATTMHSHHRARPIAESWISRFWDPPMDNPNEKELTSEWHEVMVHVRTLCSQILEFCNSNVHCTVIARQHFSNMGLRLWHGRINNRPRCWLAEPAQVRVHSGSDDKCGRAACSNLETLGFANSDTHDPAPQLACTSVRYCGISRICLVWDSGPAQWEISSKAIKLLRDGGGRSNWHAHAIYGARFEDQPIQSSCEKDIGISQSITPIALLYRPLQEPYFEPRQTLNLFPKCQR